MHLASCNSVRMRSALLRLLVVAILVAVGATTGVAQSTYYDRNEIPGHYTVGFYADQEASRHEISLEEGEQTFECWVAVSGDSTRVFSAVVFRMELPTGVELDGPIVWAPLDGLKQTDSATGSGAQVEFNQECLEQVGDQPAVIGRMRLRVSPEVGDFVLTPLEHRKFGLSVELCDGAKGWPKPFADPVSLEVHRKKGLWSRIQSWFGG